MHAVFALTNNDQIADTGRSTGWYLPEAAHPWKVLHTAGWTFDFVSPLGGTPTMDGVDTSDPVQSEFLEVFGPQGPVTKRPAEVDPTTIDAIVYVGGHGTMWDFPNDAALQALGRGVWEAGGIVSAVCHGPAALVNLRLSDGSYLVTGRRVAAFTDDEERAAGLAEIVPFLLASRLVERGALHIPAENWVEHVVVDGRLVTGQNPASATALGTAILSASQ